MLEAGVLIALPPGGGTLEILAIEEEKRSLAHPLYPVPVPDSSPQRSGPGTPCGRPVCPPRLRPLPDPAIYSRDALYPAASVSLVEVGHVRGLRLARVTFSPLRYNPAQGTLYVTRRLRVVVHFPAAATAVESATWDAAGVGEVELPEVESFLAQAVLNYPMARGWREPPSLGAAAVDGPATWAGSYKVRIEAGGFYRLTYADLLAAGLPVAVIDPRTWRLYEGSQQVAIRVTGEGDGRFDPGDAILFYGRVPASRYTAHNLYWLCFGGEPGRRMAARSVAPMAATAGRAWTVARSAAERFYDPLFPTADGDHWYAADLRPLAGYDHTATLTLLPPDSAVPTVTLRLGLVGYTAGSHAVNVKVNGTSLGQATWSGTAPMTATWTIETALLRAGDNSLYLSAGVPYEGVWLDTAAIEYAARGAAGGALHWAGQAGLRRYQVEGLTAGVQLVDVTDPQGPVYLTGATGGGGSPFVFTDAPVSPAAYLALGEAQVRAPAAIYADTPSNLRSTTLGADYVIVAPAAFHGAVQALADYRRAQDLRVVTIDVQDIYDEFSAGLLSPAAIQAFVASAYTNWTPPAPAYLLLVGDGSYDFLGHAGFGLTNYVPPFLAMVDPWYGETAADNRYADVEGDGLADLFVGRLPVSSAAQAAALVSKILRYERDPLPGDWNARHVFVADNADAAGDFYASAGVVYDRYVTSPWVGERITLDPAAVETARFQTRSAWQYGALLISYLGHSSWHQWAEENLLHYNDVSTLTNDRRWPVLLSMTCFTGFFHHPEYGTLDESLLRLPGGGAVATWSPSGLGVSTGHDSLLQGFYGALLDDGLTRLGPAAAAAKLDLAALSMHQDLLDTYHLLGDPAMAMNLTLRPWPYQIYMPILSHDAWGG